MSIIKAFISKHFTRVLLAVILALSAGNLITYFMYSTERQKGAQAAEATRQYQRLAEERKAHQEASDALYEASINTVTRRAQQAQAEVALYKERNRELQEAIDANRGWADSPIPPGVLNALKRP